MAFGRRKSKNPDVDSTERGSADRDQPGQVQAGPYDVADRPSTEGILDLGAVRIPAREGLQLRLEVEEQTQRVVAVTLELEGSSLQLQAFAAPKSGGLWSEILEQITESVGSQGGDVDEVPGPFGPELLARVPAQAPDGTTAHRVARFVGVDGPRWFLRGVYGGRAAVEREAAHALEDIFRNVVVVRGDVPMPPRDLLQLRLPQEMQNAAAAPAAAAEKPDLEAVKRGPEITKIG